MEIGGFFLLILVLIVLAVVGGGIYAIAAYLRARKLNTKEDLVEGPGGPGRRDTPNGRPEHLEVENEQRTRFVGSR